jgi:hypothetical protein
MNLNYESPTILMKLFYVTITMNSRISRSNRFIPTGMNQTLTLTYATLLFLSVISFFTKGLTVRNKVLTVFIFSLFLFTNVSATLRTFNGSGNFGTAALWGGTGPVAGDAILIIGTCTVENNALTDNVAYGTITVNPTGTIKWPVGGTNRLKCTDLTENGAGSVLDMTNGGKVIVTGVIGSISHFTPGIGTIERQLNGATMASFTTYYNLIINCPAGTINTGINTTINGDLTITSGSKLNWSGFNLTVSGITTVTGTMSLTSNTGTKTFYDLVITGTFNNNTVNEPFTVTGDIVNNGTFNGGTGRVTFTGATSNTITGSSTTAFGGGITMNKGISNANILDVQSVITILAGGLTMTTGTFKLSSASTITPFTADIVPSPYLIPAAAGFWVNGGTITASHTTWSVGGLLRVSAGTLNVGTLNGDWLAPRAGSTIEIDGGNLNAADRLSQFNESWNYIMTGGTLTVPTASSSTTDRAVFNQDLVGCTFNMSGGTIIIQSNGGGAGQNLGFNSKAGSGIITGGTLQIGNASTPLAETIGITSTPAVYNLTINSANVTAQLQVSNLTVTNNVTISSGILTTTTFNMFVGGNWANNGTFTAGTATTTFNGALAQSISGSSLTTFKNFTMNGAGGATLGAPETVIGILTLTNGLLTTTAANLLTLTSTASTAGANNNSFVNGPINKIGNTGFVFPVGKSGTGYQAIEISAPALATNAYTAEYMRANPISTFGSAHTTPITTVSSCEYWLLSQTVGASTVDITLYGNANSGCGANTGANYFTGNASLLSTLRVAHWNGTSWVNASAGATTEVGASPNITVKAAGISSYSPFTFGSSAINPLPVKLISFTAESSDKGALLNWTTATEKDNDHFDVERSTDGQNFTKIGEVKGNGSTTSISKYFFNDSSETSASAPIYYYRLKQIDYSNAFEYTNMVSITSANQSSMKILNGFPNPFENDMTINYNLPVGGTVTINTIDQLGRIISAIEVTGLKGVNSIKLNTSEYPKGIYLVNIAFNGTSSNYQRVVKK